MKLYVLIAILVAASKHDTEPAIAAEQLRILIATLTAKEIEDVVL
jgi:hypothetical protein